MRLVYPKFVDFEVLPVGIGQQAANDAAICVAREYAQRFKISNGEGSVISPELRRDECVILIIAQVSDFDFHDLVVER